MRLPFLNRASGGSGRGMDMMGGAAALRSGFGSAVRRMPGFSLPLFPIASALLGLAIAGTIAWLFVKAQDTLAERAAATPQTLVPVLLPDGTPRGGTEGGGGEEKAPVIDPTADPVDVPVALSASRLEPNLEPGRYGPLPKLDAEGKAPWQVYARPFPQNDPRPRIALVMTDVGLSASMTDSLVQRLPGAVTFAVPAGLAGVQAVVDKVRANGHEVLLSVPMEPVGYPRNDPGPYTLLTSLPDERNAERLDRALGSATGYVGVTTISGTRYMARRESLNPTLHTLHRRGLLFVDSWLSTTSQATRLSTEIGLPRAVSDSLIDRTASAGGIDAQLAELERLAQANGAAVGFAQPYPVTIERIANWSATLKSRGIVLAPVTAVVNRQADR